MKILYLVRHAKSSWKDLSIADINRPLNKRGKKDAPFMANLLKEQGIKPEMFITSPALRTVTTAEIFASVLAPEAKLIKVPELYLAESNTIINIIQQTGNSNNLMLFAHNPGITALSNYLSKNEIENIPTCGVVKLNFAGAKWDELDFDSCELEWFEYPKKYS